MKIVITERQEDLLMEGLPAGIRRRTSFNIIKNHLDFSILESVNPCEYSTPGDFITEMCDMMVVDFLDDSGLKVSPKDKDDFYYFMVDNFAEYLKEFYHKQCA